MDDSPDELVALICHELRAPLTPIKGYLHLLERRDEELGPAERRRIYEVLLREEQRMEDLVNDLLRATTPDGQRVVAADRVAWPALVAQQADLYRRSDEGLPITVNIGPDVADVVADAHLATGVVGNLLSNARKHAPAGTEIAISAARDGDRVVTSVRDHGAGVPVEDRDRIFDRFVQGPGANASGVGLGLFLARRSIEAMGGEIWCEDAPGGGAQLTFTLPAG